MTSLSTSLKVTCVTCGNKSVGIFRCEGCLQVFCRKHLNEHRDVLSYQLDEIVQEHNTLQQNIIENKDRQCHNLPILKQIDQWEQDSITKIQQTAEEARQQVINLTDSQKVFKSLRDLAERLEQARIQDDFVETDLQTWWTMLAKMKDDVKTIVPTLIIEESPQESLIAKIDVFKTPRLHLQNEKFEESYGLIRLEDNGRVAVHIGPENDTSFVRGIGKYSSGKHKIRFLFEKSSTVFITSFDITSSRMPIDAGFDSTYNTYGWSSNDNVLGSSDVLIVDQNFRDMKNQSSFEIDLELDCDNRKISYVNVHTKNQRELHIDITKCPFPWQIRFYLYSVGDCVRLLPCDDAI